MNLRYLQQQRIKALSNSVLSSDCIPQQQFKRETLMVDPISPDFQWALPNSASKFFDSKDGCIQERLGNILSENSKLEMKAVKLALLAYHKQFQMEAIHSQRDNTAALTALSYLLEMGEPQTSV